MISANVFGAVWISGGNLSAFFALVDVVGPVSQPLQGTNSQGQFETTNDDHNLARNL